MLKRGERLIAVGALNSYAADLKKEGHPIKTLYPTDGVFVIPSPTSVVKGSPNPNAAKLFAEFMIGDTAQKLFPADGGYSARIDIARAAGLARSQEPEDHRGRRRLHREGDRSASRSGSTRSSSSADDPSPGAAADPIAPAGCRAAAAHIIPVQTPRTGARPPTHPLLEGVELGSPWNPGACHAALVSRPAAARGALLRSLRPAFRSGRRRRQGAARDARGRRRRARSTTRP